MRGMILGCALGLALLWAGTAGAAVIHVNCANANLQSKINNAAPGSTLDIKGTCKGQFTIPKSLKLVGDPSATIDGDEGGRTLDITGPNVTLSHLVVTGGRLSVSAPTVAFGGGISANGSNLTLRHVTVRGNTVEGTGGPADLAIVLGGGIYSAAGSLTLIDSKVTGNVARGTAGQDNVYAGGIYRGLDLTLIRTTVKDNRAVADDGGQDSLAQGGGIYDDEGHVEIRSSHVDGNKARVNGPAGGANAEGGGLYMGDGESLLVVHSTFNGNRASATTGGTTAAANGGGIGGNVTHGTITRSKLSSNTVHVGSTDGGDAAGGGAGVQVLDTLELVSTRVASNAVDIVAPGSTGASGGGLQLRGAGTLELQRSTVDRNTTSAPNAGGGTGGGAGIQTFGDLALKSSTVSRNVARAGLATGGGIELVGTGSGTVRNSTIAANKAIGVTARGGGMDTFVNLNVTSSTIAGNSAKIGGGLYKEVMTTILQGTIVAGNTASMSGPNCGGNIDSAGQNLISKTSGCTFAATPSDILHKGAKLGVLGNHGGPTQTIPLQSGSPARNAIPVAKCQVNQDQRGVKRPQGPRCDIGSFEVKR
jgi:hypothetical protein